MFSVSAKRLRPPPHLTRAFLKVHFGNQYLHTIHPMCCQHPDHANVKTSAKQKYESNSNDYNGSNVVATANMTMVWTDENQFPQLYNRFCIKNIPQ